MIPWSLYSLSVLIVCASAQISGQNIDYNECGKTQTCFGTPSGCVSDSNCNTIITITYTEPTYKIQLATSAASGYVALGLSEDTRMGKDSTIECVQESGNTSMFTSYTGQDYSGSVRHSATGIAGLLDSSYVDGVIYCYVERNETGVVVDQDFDLFSTQYYLFIAIGDDVFPNRILQHKQIAVSARAIFLRDVTDLAVANKPLLIQLHGCFMIVAWMGTAAVGLVLARYFKNEWSGKTLFGKDLWFIGHQICMVVTWTLTMVGTIIIFVHVGGWTRVGNIHAILGLIVTILCFLQPIGAVFRPDPKHPKRYRFNISHYFFGRVAFLLAVVNIFFAVYLPSAELPTWFIAFLAIFVVVFWGNHILMNVMDYLAHKKTNVMRAFVGPAKRVDYETADYRAWYVRLKTKVLIVYVTSICVLLICSICIFALVRN